MLVSGYKGRRQIAVLSRLSVWSALGLSHPWGNVRGSTEVFVITVDEDSLIRHYSFSLSDRLEIELRRRDHNRLGLPFSYVMRYRAG